MKFVSYNIQYGLGKDDCFDIERIADAVAGADVIALQEVSRHMPMAPAEDQVERLSRLLPQYYFVFGPAIDVNGSTGEASGRIANRRIQYGNMVLSRTPILTSIVHPLPKQTLVDFHSYQRVALETTLDCGVGPLRVYSVHLSPNNPFERQMQVEKLSRLHRQAQCGRRMWTGPGGWFEQHGVATIETAREAVIMGDFNLEPDSDEYTGIVGAVDPVFGRISSSTNFVDSWVRAGNAEDSGVTCPRCIENNTLHDMRIDYGFVSSGLADRVKSAWIDTHADGSDHQPIWFDLDV